MIRLPIKPVSNGSALTFCCRLIPFILLTLWAASGISNASESHQSHVNFLKTKYGRIEPMLKKNVFNMPLYVESREEGLSAGVDVYGVVDYPYATVRTVLEKPENWCDVAMLHINDKACTYIKAGQEWHLTLYSGRKYYQPPENTHRLVYNFDVRTAAEDYLSLQLHAADGPLSTRNHRITAEIVPLDNEKTLVRLSYSFSYGTMGMLAMKSYFATIGRGKIGFSAAGTDEHGSPIHVGGIKGAIERNVVRYYCAIIAYLDALKYPKDHQFEKRISRWFDLTDRHKKQLHELDKETYLQNKRREHSNQINLQIKATKTIVSSQ